MNRSPSQAVDSFGRRPADRTAGMQEPRGGLSDGLAEDFQAQVAECRALVVRGTMTRTGGIP